MSVLNKLSNRQREIVSYIAGGYCNKEISSLIGIKESTLESHMTDIYLKLGVNNRIEIVRVYLKEMNDGHGNYITS